MGLIIGPRIIALNSARKKHVRRCETIRTRQDDNSHAKVQNVRRDSSVDRRVGGAITLTRDDVLTDEWHGDVGHLAATEERRQPLRDEALQFLRVASVRLVIPPVRFRACAHQGYRVEMNTRAGLG